MDTRPASSSNTINLIDMDRDLKFPLVTVFMAVYNSENYVYDAVNSILQQTYSDFELLIINDGSTDNSEIIIKSFNDPRIKLIKNSENRGLAYTRNLGIKEAKGKYYAILDSDDIAVPERLSIQVNFMETRRDVALCGGHAIIIDRNGQSTGQTIKVPTTDDLQVRMLLGNQFINSSLMIKTEVLKEIGGYQNYTVAEDYQLAMDIGYAHQIANIDHILVKYRLHGQNISVKAEMMERFEKKIIAGMHQALSITMQQPNIVDTHHSLLSNKLDNHTSTQYLRLLSSIKSANQQKKILDPTILERFITEKWFNILKEKQEKRFVYYFFHSSIFNWKHVNLKQAIKAIKTNIKILLKG